MASARAENPVITPEIPRGSCATSVRKKTRKVVSIVDMTEKPTSDMPQKVLIFLLMRLMPIHLSFHKDGVPGLFPGSLLIA